MMNPNELENILRADESLTDEQRSDVWDAYVQSGSHSDLSPKLKDMSITPQTHNALVAAKINETPAVHRAVDLMATLGPEKLALAEKFPTVFKALMAEHNGVKP